MEGLRQDGNDACMPDYCRARVPGGTFFFTVALADRGKTTLIDHIDLLRQSVRATRQARPFMIEAMVVMPDHLHAVWTLPAEDADYAARWASIKAAFSRGLPCGEWRSKSRESKRKRGIWQRRYWEHLIRDKYDFRAHVDYVHINPLKHGTVPRVADWPYSTFHHWVAKGAYPENWSGEIAECDEPS